MSKNVFQDLTGETFHSWTVLERAANGSNKRTRWKCRCKCGRKGIVAAGDLKYGSHKSCGKCHYHAFIQDSFWGEYKKQAKRRNKIFLLTKDYMMNLWEQQDGKCAISGEILFMPEKAREQRGPKCTASIDRIDNSKGYIEDNVQWVLKSVNRMRREYSMEEYIQVCKKVAKNWENNNE